MFLRELARVLRRRWQFLIVALLLAAGVAFLMLRVVAADYRTSASVVLVPPETTLGDTGNPYLFLGGLDQTVDVLARSLNNGDARAAIEDATPIGGGYTADADFTTSAPIILVTTEATTADEASALLDVVLERVTRNLNELQSDVGVPPRSQIGSQVVARDEPEALQKPRLRQVGIITIASLLALLLLIAAVDSVLARRRRTED